MESRAVPDDPDDPDDHMHRALNACGDLIEEMYVRLLVDRRRVKELACAITHFEHIKEIALFEAALHRRDHPHSLQRPDAPH